MLFPLTPCILFLSTPFSFLIFFSLKTQPPFPRSLGTALLDPPLPGMLSPHSAPIQPPRRDPQLDPLRNFMELVNCHFFLSFLSLQPSNPLKPTLHLYGASWAWLANHPKLIRGVPATLGRSPARTASFGKGFCPTVLLAGSTWHPRACAVRSVPSALQKGRWVSHSCPRAVSLPVCHPWRLCSTGTLLHGDSAPQGARPAPCHPGTSGPRLSPAPSRDMGSGQGFGGSSLLCPHVLLSCSAPAALGVNYSRPDSTKTCQS